MKKLSAVLSVLGLVSVAEAQDPVNGTWELASPSAESTARETAIEGATEEMSRFMRGRARSHLRQRTEPAPRLRVRRDGDQLELRGRRSLTLRIGGPAVEVEGEGGQGEVQATRRNGDLVVTLRGGNGVWVTTYRPSEDGRFLHLDVVITGERLAEPIRYRVTYRRRE
ncbi:MAG: hypothetical protein AAGE52_40320 [Myxococcota bacterium]